jgi:leucyl-tRNA synthetase
MVLNQIFQRTSPAGRREYFNPADFEITPDGARLKSDGGEVVPEGLGTMSKSRNNGVDPNGLVQKYGADTARLFMMFTAPPEQSLEWSDEGVQGAHRFLRRLWKAVYEHVSGTADSPDAAADRELRRLAHQTLGKVKDDIGRRRVFNTAIAQVMELLNGLSKHAGARAVRQEALEIAVLCLAPIVPHVTHALWHELGHATPLHAERWREADPAALVQDLVEVVVQINGKLRGRLLISPMADRGAVEAAALADPQVGRFLEGKAPKKVIVVPGKLVNLVV